MTAPHLELPAQKSSANKGLWITIGLFALLASIAIAAYLYDRYDFGKPEIRFLIGITLTLGFSVMIASFLNVYLQNILDDCKINASKSWARFASGTLVIIALLFALFNPMPIDLLVAREKSILKSLSDFKEDIEQAET